MSKLTLSLVLCSLCIASLVEGQVNSFARYSGFGDASVAISDDAFAIFTNPAGINQLRNRQIGFNYSPSPFGLNELSSFAVAYVEPSGFGTFGLSAFSYGFELYRENSFSLTYANRIQNILLFGIRIKYNTLSIKNYGSDSNIGIDLGLLTSMNDKINFGFSVKNINRPTWGESEDRLPQIFNGGLAYKPIEDVVIGLEVEKDIKYPFNVKFGLEYNIIKYISLRFGLNNEPSKFTGGVGIHYSMFHLDYALLTHQDLGLSHVFGLMIKFNSSK